MEKHDETKNPHSFSTPPVPLILWCSFPTLHTLYLELFQLEVTRNPTQTGLRKRVSLFYVTEGSGVGLALGRGGFKNVARSGLPLSPPGSPAQGPCGGTMDIILTASHSPRSKSDGGSSVYVQQLKLHYQKSGDSLLSGKNKRCPLYLVDCIKTTQKSPSTLVIIHLDQ